MEHTWYFTLIKDLHFYYSKLTKAWVKSWVEPRCGLVLVVDVVNFSL